jgi:hypothetical protein
MADSFLSSVGGKVAEQFVAQLYAPAYVFWAGGAALYAHAHWSEVRSLAETLKESEIVVLGGAWLLLVTASASIGQRFEPTVIRILEGYHWPAWLRERRKALFRDRYKKNENLLQSLAPKVESGKATEEERRQYVEADLRQRTMPPDPTEIMPTRLGNILRSAERRIEAKYGLDPRICGARLWLLISNDVRESLSTARSALDIGARSFLWGGLFAIWAFLSWWALAVAIVALLASYAWMVNAADEYGELLESAFDLFRFALYKSLCLRLPSESSEEPALGKLLTQFLWRGDVPAVFKDPGD